MLVCVTRIELDELEVISWPYSKLTGMGTQLFYLSRPRPLHVQARDVAELFTTVSTCDQTGSLFGKREVLTVLKKWKAWSQLATSFSLNSHFKNVKTCAKMAGDQPHFSAAVKSLLECFRVYERWNGFTIIYANFQCKWGNWGKWTGLVLMARDWQNLFNIVLRKFFLVEPSSSPFKTMWRRKHFSVVL